VFFGSGSQTIYCRIFNYLWKGLTGCWTICHVHESYNEPKWYAPLRSQTEKACDRMDITNGREGNIKDPFYLEDLGKHCTKYY
jgi:hypothetical protein